MNTNHERLISRQALYFLLGLFALGWLFYALRGVLAPVLLAFLLAYAFNPLVETLARRRVPRSLASVLCLFLLAVITFGLFALIVPTIHQEIQSVSKKLPLYLQHLRESTIPWLETTLGVDLPASIDEALSSARQRLNNGELGQQMLAIPVASFFETVLSGTLSLISTLLYLVIVPLFTFFFLNDYKQITAWFVSLIPPRHQERVLTVSGEIDGVLSGFLRAQLTICCILALLYSIALSICGVPAGITIGIVSGLFNMVPYLGTAVGLLLSCFFLLLEGSAWSGYLAVGGVFVGVNIIDGLFITPNILGKRLGLAPVAVILAIMVFSELFGFLGVLMAVPVTAIGKVLATRALAAYRKSPTYAENS